jgi:hypothetical protein
MHGGGAGAAAARHGTAAAAAAEAKRWQRWLRLYGDDEMQHDDATIKQSGRDEMRQGTRRRLDDDETNFES